MLKDKKRLLSIIAIALATILIPTGGFFTYRYLTKADDIDGKTELLSKLEESEKEEAKEDKKEKKKEDKEDKKEENKEDKKEESTNIVVSEEKALSSNQTKEVTTNTNKKTTKKHEAKANNSKSNVKAINKLATHKAVATQNTNVAANNNGWVKDDEAVARAKARLYARTHKNSTVTTSTSNVSGGKRLIRRDPIYEEHSMVRDNTSGRLFKKSEEWKQYWKDNMRKKSNGESYEDCGGTAVVPVTYIVGYKYKYSDGTSKKEYLSKPKYLGGEISFDDGRTITW